MGGVPVIIAIINCERKLHDYAIGDFIFSTTSPLELLLEKYSYRLAFLALTLAYILARAYLAVECFINLSHLPVGVYDVPS